MYAPLPRRGARKNFPVLRIDSPLRDGYNKSIFA